MSRVFPLAQRQVFRAFSDPQSHVPLFSIIKGSTPAVRHGIHRILPANQFFAFEHVQEGALPPRIMLVKYTLDAPRRITKEAVTDPFTEGDIVILDRKKGIVKLTFQKVAAKKTRIVAESKFQTSTGAVFAREFVDLVWLNFFERMMVANGEITEGDMLTKEYI
jgi:hypothetical protein